MSPDKVPDALIALAVVTGLAFGAVMLRGALWPMQASARADLWKQWFFGLLAVLVLEGIGIGLFALL